VLAVPNDERHPLASVRGLRRRLDEWLLICYKERLRSSGAVTIATAVKETADCRVGDVHEIAIVGELAIDETAVEVFIDVDEVDQTTGGSKIRRLCGRRDGVTSSLQIFQAPLILTPTLRYDLSQREEFIETQALTV
jgi:hypothetical protein